MSQSTPEFVKDAGGSILSKHVYDGVAPLKWAFREESMNPVDNGWRFLSLIDDDAFLANPDNMLVVDFNQVVAIEPAVLPILNLPVGTDLQIVSEAGKPIQIIDNATGQPLTF